MLKKVSFFVGVMLLSLIGVFSFGESKASADYSTGWSSFHSADGAYDGILTTSTYDRTVSVSVRGLWQASFDGSAYIPGYADNLRVRLCNVSTGACTSYRELFYGGYQDGHKVWNGWFYEMKVGKFYVDIADIMPGRYMIGERKILVR